MRPYRPDDAARVPELYRQVHAGDPSVAPLDLATWNGFVARAACRQGRDFAVVEEDGQLVALLSASLFEDPRLGGQVRHFRILVHPSYRRRHLARGLVAHVEQLARSEGAAVLQAMTQRDWLAGHALLERAGFTVVMRDVLLSRPCRPVERAGLPEGVSLRPYAGASDDPAWAELSNTGFARDAVGSTETAESVKSHTLTPGFALWVAEREGRSIGFCHVATVRARVGAIQGLVVDRTSEGQGIGTALLAAGLQTLRSGRHESVELVTESDNHRALRLYRRFGFEAIDELCTWRRAVTR